MSLKINNPIRLQNIKQIEFRSTFLDVNAAERETEGEKSFIFHHLYEARENFIAIKSFFAFAVFEFWFVLHTYGPAKFVCIYIFDSSNFY